MAIAFSRAQTASRGRADRAEGTGAQPFVEAQDRALISRARAGDPAAMDKLIDKYRGFVRMKASAYFLAGGESEDLIQEGLIGFFKAVRDYRVDREASFRSFAELCVTRQIITAIKTAARNKHAPLNTYVSFSHTRAGSSGDQEMSLAEVLPSDPVVDPVSQVISSEELRSLVGCLGETLSDLESGVLTMYLEGRPYEEIAGRLDCTPKTVDNALQRVKRKVQTHLRSREVIDLR
ncbi:RNA polymerase sporulation sigma factor SigH [Miltoncostaea marina]|uniref:RNA polymerase sporulation sigma factor SigH n=1 Tax=Miltoncostaea marina TaxID=2843215 RepID=UPI001C3D95CE|nr:RNA polymerase sporulation sigma factor SigH [Miltoncostaea marina]